MTALKAPDDEDEEIEDEGEEDDDAFLYANVKEEKVEEEKTETWTKEKEEAEEKETKKPVFPPKADPLSQVQVIPHKIYKTPQLPLLSNPTEQTALYIGNLQWWTTDQDLEDAAREYGKIKTIKFFENKMNGKSKGYAFVEFHDPFSAKSCKEGLQGRILHDKPIIINFVSASTLKELQQQQYKGSGNKNKNSWTNKGPRKPYFNPSLQSNFPLSW